MYYYQSLYGPRNQAVIYIEPFDDQHDLNTIQNIKNITGKKVLFISIGTTTIPGVASTERSDWEFINSQFDLVPCALLSKTNSVWNIHFESSESIPKECR